MKQWGVIIVVIVGAFLSGCAVTSVPSGSYKYDPLYGANAQSAQEKPNVQMQQEPQQELKPFQGPPSGEKVYLNIGANPVNPNRPAAPEEQIKTLATDVYAVTESKKKTISKGWLKAGEKVFVVVASDPRYLEAVGIVRCGNPILNREHDIQPIWFKNPNAPKEQPAAAAAPARTAPKQETISCRDRKSGWGSVIGGIVGFAIGIFTHDPGIAAATSAGGSLIGGYLDGRCIEPSDVAVAAGWGIAGYGLTKPKSSGHKRSSSSDGGSNGRPAPPPANGPANGGGPAPLPPN